MITLRGYQREAVDAAHAAFAAGTRRPAIGLPTGCHEKGAPILMADGRIVPVEDVRVGDELAGYGGERRHVLALARGTGQMVRVVPIKGEPWLVNRDHVLTLVETQASNKKRHPSSNRGGTIRDVTVDEWLRASAWSRHTHKIIRQPFDFGELDEELPIEPWLLGALLGDGTLRTPYRVGFAGIDRECLDAVGAAVGRLGLRLIHAAGCSYRISGRKARNGNPLVGALRALCLNPVNSGNRFVPLEYLRGSRRARAEILAGLLDTDGSARNGGYDFLSKSRQLAQDVSFLARSLGLAAYISDKAVDGAIFARVSISGDCSGLPLRINRKRVAARLQKKDVLRTGFQLQPLELEDQYFGFSLDGDGRYLMGDFTVTHNTGKTIVFSALAEERRPLGRALILAHRDELLRQAADKYREVAPGADIGFVQAGLNDLDHDVVVASVQSLTQPRRLDAFPWHLFATMIIDEAHHAVAPTYRRIIDRAGDDTLVLGVSATLERGDGVGLSEVWQQVVYLKTLQEMIQAGYLVDIRARRVRLNYNMGRLRTNRGDFVASEVSEMLEATHAYSVAARAYLEHAPGRKAIVFTPTIRDAHVMAATFQQAGVTAEAVDGEMNLDDRRAVLARFKSDETMVVANAMVLTEGFDEPSVGCIIVARPTKSRPLYVQMIGRGTRLYPGKDDLIVLDLIGNDERLDLQSLPRLFGLKASTLEEAGTGAVRYLSQGAKAIAGLYDPRAGISSEEVDLFERKDIAWSKLVDGRWLLDLGSAGKISLEPKGGKWRTIHVAKDEHGKLRWETLGDDLDIGYAMGVAEEYLRTSAPEAMRLVDKSAPWRANEPSQKQLDLMGSLGIPVEAGMTRGQASELIGAALARKKQRVS